MKTTLEIPDAVIRQAKARAAERGIPLRQFVIEAVADKLQADVAMRSKPWMKGVAVCGICGRRPRASTS